MSPDCFVCMSVKELRRPHVPSERHKCSGCGTDVWIDRHLVLMARAMRILCLKCASDSSSWL